MSMEWYSSFLISALRDANTLSSFWSVIGRVLQCVSPYGIPVRIQHTLAQWLSIAQTPDGDYEPMQDDE